MASIKTNFKIGEKVSITKIGIFFNLSGIVLSNNIDTSFKPLSIILNNGNGTWQFNYEDIKPIKGDSEIIETPSQDEVKFKRKYNKKS